MAAACPSRAQPARLHSIPCCSSPRRGQSSSFLEYARPTVTAHQKIGCDHKPGPLHRLRLERYIAVRRDKPSGAATRPWHPPGLKRAAARQMAWERDPAHVILEVRAFSPAPIRHHRGPARFQVRRRKSRIPRLPLALQANRTDTTVTDQGKDHRRNDRSPTALRSRLGHAWVVVLIALLCSQQQAAGQYTADIGRWTAQDTLDPPAPGAILFAGSSSIRRWEQLALDFADYRVIQRGFGGAHFDHLNTYMNDIVLPYNATAIVVWAGTNDIAGGGDGAEVFADYQEFVTTVHAAQPNVHIFYLGIMPTPGRFANGPEETIANNAIAAVAAGDARLHYIDLPTPFWALNPPYDPAFTSLFVDSIHLNRQGYDFWTSIIRPDIEAVIAPNKVATANPNTPPAGGRILFDFGPSNSADGNHTLSPDTNGNHWNNWHPAEGGIAINAGEHLGNLVDVTGTAAGISLTITGRLLLKRQTQRRIADTRSGPAGRHRHWLGDGGLLLLQRRRSAGRRRRQSPRWIHDRRARSESRLRLPLLRLAQ